ncbi:DUF4241 domain-containing protein [Streptomyces sp. 351MFTsu5.1]|uniref:DUF4241 domain-containing protein n=1 Tax=Streptomyces sp. 351MFTsu5.1 TaxID=1172180 RepID=UPI0003A75D51|nr:DUF4241 domain-containing protein [Streptomyces sp. 351MFTsu5.1]
MTSPSTGRTLVAFTSGWGDGFCPTWIGRSASGEVTCFLTDFFVAPDPSCGAAIPGRGPVPRVTVGS